MAMTKSIIRLRNEPQRTPGSDNCCNRFLILNSRSANPGLREEIKTKGRQIFSGAAIQGCCSCSELQF